MIQLPDTPLPLSTQRRLTAYQNDIDTRADYTERVAAAKDRFAAYNSKGNSTFKSIKEVLANLCSGARRCMYCEDSCADEVEHFKPKDLYPESVFVWENYLYACGPCNGPKNNQFAVFSHYTGRSTDVTRPHGAVVVPPEAGDPVLIDPRRENPLKYMELDLLGTFYFLAVGQPDTIQYQRAEYTIRVLRLNERDDLTVARADAYVSYRARLQEYIVWRNDGKPKNQLDELVIALKRMGHPTVWQEMKRQQRLIPELKGLFDQAPEALDW